MELRDIAEAVHSNAVKKGFWEGDAGLVPVKLALIHSEVSEALEAHRKGMDDEFLAEELADIIIRVLDLAEGIDIDIASWVEMKMEKNMGRPVRHGNNRY